MSRFSRRTFARAVAFAPAMLVPCVAHATLLRGLGLREMTAQSRHVLLLTPLASQCSTISLGGRQLIVTETSARVDELIGRAAPTSATVVVRSLGGVLNGAGLRVDGQAQFAIGATCVAFLTPSSDGSLWVTGMAQGHFPLESAAGKRYLTASPRLPELLDFEHSGVRVLAGRELAEAQRLVREASVR